MTPVMMQIKTDLVIFGWLKISLQSRKPANKSLHFTVNKTKPALWERT